jgi:hypothetical protein
MSDIFVINQSNVLYIRLSPIYGVRGDDGYEIEVYQVPKDLTQHH